MFTLHFLIDDPFALTATFLCFRMFTTTLFARAKHKLFHGKTMSRSYFNESALAGKYKQNLIRVKCMAFTAFWCY
jgi:hypothetical protein